MALSDTCSQNPWKRSNQAQAGCRMPPPPAQVTEEGLEDPHLPVPCGACSRSRLGVRGINWSPLPSPGPPPPASVPSASSSSPGFSPCQGDPWPHALRALLSGRRPQVAHLSPSDSGDHCSSCQSGSGTALNCGHLQRAEFSP